MSNRVKAGLCLALFVVLWSVYVYLTWGATQVVAREWIALGPIRWVDFFSGAFAMFVVMLIAFVGFTLRETNRFDREVGGDGGDSGGSTGGSGGPKRVRLPMRNKVIDIATWQPPDGRYHRGAAAPA